MSESIIVALITGGLALIGTVISTRSASNRTTREVEHKLETQQAVTNAKIEELTREVREHNNFARRVPVLEAFQKSAEKRLDGLESFHKHP